MGDILYFCVNFSHYYFDFTFFFVYLHQQTNKYNKKMVTTISVRATIARLEVGEQVEIPLQLRKSNSVRNCASVLGTDTGKRYSVSINRENRSCIVTRTR